MIDMDAPKNADNKEQLKVEETDDSCILELFEIVPLARDTDGSYTTECVSGDWSAEVKQQDLAVAKQEPDDNYGSGAVCFVRNDDVPAKASESQSDMDTVVLLGTLNMSCCSTTECVSGDYSSEIRQENLANVKQERDDEDESSTSCSVKSDALPADIDEKLSHMRPVVVLETLNLAQLHRKYHVWINTGGNSLVKTEADDATECSRDDQPITGSSSFEVKTEADSSDHTEHSHDDKPRPYLCTVCGRQFSSLTAQCKHMNIHLAKYKCTECGRCCQSSRDLAVHGRRHTGEKPFECTVCGERFAASFHLARHGRIHSGEKPYKRSHEGPHGTKLKLYKCKACGKAFCQPGRLNVHVQECGTNGENWHRCSKCDKRCLSQRSLGQHMNIHRGKYRCTECGKCFRDNQDLAVHSRSHSGEKPFECGVCGKRFTKSSHLVEHSRIHGEKLYKCHLVT